MVRPKGENIKRILLIGMPGSGKSTLGAALAQELAIPFFDLDREIEKSAGLSIQEIFENSGEEGFRKLESEKLEEVLKTTGNMVLASGGGTPSYYNGIEKMLNAHFLVFYLQADIEIVFDRIEKSHEFRPLIAGLSREESLKRLKKLLAERETDYLRASFVVKTDILSLEDALKQAVEICV